MNINMENYWKEFEYNKLKLLTHNEKLKSVMDVYRGLKKYDEMFPISVELHLTDLCNLSCPWCTDKLLRENRATIQIEIVKNLFDLFGKAGTGVTLEGGGEPTLHKEFGNIASYGKTKNVDLGLITNGTIDIKKEVSNFKWIRVSLDSSNRKEYIKEKGKDCFDQVLQNIKLMAENRDRKETFIGVGYVLTKNNHDSLEELIKKLDEIEVDYIYFRPVEEAKEIMPDLEELYELKKKLVVWTENKRIKYLFNITDRIAEQNMNLPCVAHSLTSIIHADGIVSLCEKRRTDEIMLGNLNDLSFETIWNSKLREEVTRKLMNPENQKCCSVCRITSFNNIIDSLTTLNTTNFI